MDIPSQGRKYSGVMSTALAERYAFKARQQLERGDPVREIQAVNLPITGRIIADIAAGPGQWTAALAMAGARQVVWADKSSHMLTLSKKLHQSLAVQPSYVLGALEAIPLADRCVDGALCFDAIYHSPDQRGTARELYRIIRKGGFLWLRTRTFRRVLLPPVRHWKAPVLACAPVLHWALGLRIAGNIFAIPSLLRHDLVKAGFRVQISRRVDSSTWEIIASK